MTSGRKTLRQRLQETSGLKSLLTVVAVVLIYIWASQGLGITPSKLVSGETWRNMVDLVIRLGPYDRINNCRNANLAWGDDDPIAGKSDPAKVRAVCEEEKTLYLYQFGNLKEQVRYAADIWEPLMQTFRMAIVGATIGALLAVPLAILSSQNLMRSRWIYYTVRWVLNLIRTIPDLVLAAVLSGIFGLGALPGVMALAVFSFALVAKLLSESMEAIDPGPLEAMQACGANRLQQIRYGVVPQVLPQYLAYSLYVLEVDVRASFVLGFVGAGGIGQLLQTDLNLGRYPKVGAIVAMLLVAVMLLDYISTKLRERLV